MQVFHTAGVPPSSGRINLPTMGCTMKSKRALVNRVKVNAESVKKADFTGVFQLQGVKEGAYFKIPGRLE